MTPPMLYYPSPPTSLDSRCEHDIARINGHECPRTWMTFMVAADPGAWSPNPASHAVHRGPSSRGSRDTPESGRVAWWVMSLPVRARVGTRHAPRIARKFPQIEPDQGLLHSDLSDNS
jgi:hypothetical protein